MFKKLKERISRKVSVSLVILSLLFLAFYAAGFIEAKTMNRNRHLTINSSFFDRNPKEIAEGFKKYVEENKGVNVKEVKINKGEIRITTDVQNDTTFDEVEYILTKDGIQCMYKSNTNMDEDRWKQLIVNDSNFELN